PHRCERGKHVRGGSPREGVQSTPKRGSPRGVGSEVRAQQRLAAGGAAPPTRIVRYAFVLYPRLALEQVFVRTCVLMTVDARGVLWIDDPLLVLGLLSLLWVLIASLHGDPWLRWHGYARQLAQRVL